MLNGAASRRAGFALATVISTAVYAQSSPEEVLRTRPGWEKVSSGLRSRLAERLKSSDNARRFAAVCERAGIVDDKIVRWSKAEVEPLKVFVV